MRLQKGFATLSVLFAIILGLIIVGGGAYFVMHKNTTPQIQVTTNTNIQTSADQGQSAAPQQPTLLPKVTITRKDLPLDVMTAIDTALLKSSDASLGSGSNLDYSVQPVDLVGNGSTAYIVANITTDGSGWGGAQNQPQFIFEKVDGSWKTVFYGWVSLLNILPTKTNGQFDVTDMVHLSADNIPSNRITWNSIKQEYGAKDPMAQQNSSAPATGVYVDVLRVNMITGIAATDGTTDIYIYGPNNGNGADVGGAGGEPSGPGALVFSKKNVPVANGKWSVQISPALKAIPGETYSQTYYQVNIGNPVTGSLPNLDDLTRDRTGEDFNLFNVNDGPACGTQPSATIIQSSLDQAGSEKTLAYGIDGYACNTPTVSMAVSAHGTQIWKSAPKTVANGQWNIAVSKDIVGSQDIGISNPDTYTVHVYDANNILLASGSFTVKANIATIDSGSLTQSLSASNNTLRITGTALSKVQVWLVAASYTGPTDSESLFFFSRDEYAYPHYVVGKPNTVMAGGVTLSTNDTWAATFKGNTPTTFGGVVPGTYKVLVMDVSESNKLLATGILNLTE